MDNCRSCFVLPSLPLPHAYCTGGATGLASSCGAEPDAEDAEDAVGDAMTGARAGAFTGKFCGRGAVTAGVTGAAEDTAGATAGTACTAVDTALTDALWWASEAGAAARPAAGASAEADKPTPAPPAFGAAAVCSQSICGAKRNTSGLLRRAAGAPVPATAAVCVKAGAAAGTAADTAGAAGAEDGATAGANAAGAADGAYAPEMAETVDAVDAGAAATAVTGAKGGVCKPAAAKSGSGALRVTAATIVESSSTPVPCGPCFSAPSTRVKLWPASTNRGESCREGMGRSVSPVNSLMVTKRWQPRARKILRISGNSSAVRALVS